MKPFHLKLLTVSSALLLCGLSYGYNGYDSSAKFARANTWNYQGGSYAQYQAYPQLAYQSAGYGPYYSSDYYKRSYTRSGYSKSYYRSRGGRYRGYTRVYTSPYVSRSASFSPGPIPLTEPTNDNLPKRITAPGEKTFVFNPQVKRWAAYDPEGYRVAAGIANGGSDYCPDLGHICHTPTGTYRISLKKGPECVSRKFPVGVGGAAMPYCMYFGAGFAIHGSAYISDRNGSHGCIRVHTPAAAWLSNHFVQPGTKVVVMPY